MSDSTEQKTDVAAVSGSGHHISLPGVARNGLWITFVAVVAYFVLFWLPFRFPPGQRLMSASFAFGFNNGIAIAALAALLGLASMLYLLVRRGEHNRLPVTFPLERAASGRRALMIAFLSLALFYAGLTWAMYAYDVRSAPSLMWETRHLLYRTWVMDVYKLRPYTEIAAEYGPILTYAPLYIYWLLEPLGVSHLQAYFVSYLVLNLAGLWCAYYIFSRAFMPTRARIISFSVIAVAGFGLYMGINGVLLRYLFPFASLLLGHRILSRTLSSRRGVIIWLAASALVLMLSSINVLLSSEVGIAFSLAWIAYAVLRLRSDARFLVVSLPALSGTALLGWLFLPAAYFGTLLRFSEGANNLPLLPAAHILFYILTLFLLVPNLVAVSLRAPRGGDPPDRALCGALGALCVVMSPGALGRCDPPHVLFYGIGASMLLLVALANTSRAAFISYGIAYAGVFIVLLELVNLRVFYGIPPRSLLSRHLVPHLAAGFRSAIGTEHLSAATLSALDKYPRLGLPYASFGDPAVERYVVSRGHLQPEYYVAIVGVYNSAALKHKLSDVGKMEYLLVPQRFLRPSPSHLCADYLTGLRRWFFYPANLPCRAEPLDPGAALSQFIVEHYAPVERVGSWAVLKKVGRASQVSSGL